jgi:hypothetical protein
MDRQDLDIELLWKDPVAGLKALTNTGCALKGEKDIVDAPLSIEAVHGPIASSPGNRCGCGVLPNSCPGEPVRPC